MGWCISTFRTESSRWRSSSPSRRCSRSRPPLRIPYPILLVLGGLAIGVVPGCRSSSSTPELVFFGVLPPLLYGAAFFTSLRDLRAQRSADRAAGGRPRRRHDRRRGRRRARVHRRSPVGERLRARRDRLADRSARGDLDRAPPRRSAEARDDRRGREPRERRHRARRSTGSRSLRWSPARSRPSTPAGCSS